MLVFLAVIPPLLILFLINRYCETKRSDIKLFALLFFAGGLLITLVAMFGGDALTRAAGTVLGGSILFILISNIFTVALPEEALKYVILRWRFAKGDRFTDPLYAIAVSVTLTMGFSFYEQMVYTLGEGIATVIMRAILSVPGHMAHAILMGWFLHLAAVCKVAGDDAGKKKNFRLALLVPTLTHGIYDIIISLNQQYGSDLLIALIFLYTAGLLFYTIRLLRRVKAERKDAGGGDGNNRNTDITDSKDNNTELPEVFYE